jgi:hypothetical protein
LEYFGDGGDKYLQNVGNYTNPYGVIYQKEYSEKRGGKHPRSVNNHIPTYTAS